MSNNIIQSLLHLLHLVVEIDLEKEENVHPVIDPLHPSHHHDHEERLQHPDEETDRYLSHLFTPSAANLTTVLDEHTQHDTHTDEFHRLRNFFASDAQHTKLSTIPSESSVQNVSSHDSSLGLRTLFEEKSVVENVSDAPNVEDKRMIMKKKKVELLLHLLHLVVEEENIHSVIAPPPPSHHDDEKTDMCSSTVNTTTAVDEHTQNDTHTDEFQRLRNLFSSDAQHTKLPTIASESSIRNVSSHDTSLGLRTLFEEKSFDVVEKEFQRLRNLFSSDAQHTKLPTVASESSIRTVSSHDTFLGLRTLFEEKSADVVEKEFQRLRNLFSSDAQHTKLPTVASESSIRTVSSHETSLGLRTLFEEKSAAVVENVSDAPNVEDKQLILKKVELLLLLLHLIAEKENVHSITAPPPPSHTPSTANVTSDLGEGVPKNDSHTDA